MKALEESTEPRFSQIAGTFTRKTGLKIPDSQRQAAASRIRRAVGRHADGDAGEYLRLLDHDPRVFDELVTLLTVPETYFFRTVDHFEYIRDLVLTDWRATGPGHRGLRVWSAGCSTGEEPYSLAMLLADEQLLVGSTVLGTDISQGRLEHARRAEYRGRSVRGEAPACLEAYLVASEAEYRVDEALRTAVEFRHLNLLEDPYPDPERGLVDQDLIMCCNVLIYLDEPQIERVACGLAETLAPDGWLVCGPSDPLLSQHAALEPIVTRAGTYYRRAEVGTYVVPELQSRPVPDFEAVPDVEPQARVEPQPVRQAEAATSGEGDLALARQALVAGDYQEAAGLSETGDGESSWLLRVQSWSNLDTNRALSECRRGLEVHATSVDLNMMCAVLLWEQRDCTAAVVAARRALYLDREAVMAHFVLACLSRQRGKMERARRGFCNVRRLCSRMEPDALVRLSDGRTAGAMAQDASREVDRLDSAREDRS